MDVRNQRLGRLIPTKRYCDQPYMVKTDDGAWLVAVTTGAGVEGASGQHVVTMRSLDRGQSWSEPVEVEPADGPEASYAVLLKAPSGRVFCFYNHNTDNLRRVKADDPPFAGGWWTRVDSQGHYVFRYSDDGGQSWSRERIEIPQRLFEIDRQNPYGGEVRFFWNVGRPFLWAGEAFLTLHKIGRFGVGGYARSEGVLLHSPDLAQVADPREARWETLPEGDIGLRTPAGGGPIAEEQCCVPLSDGSFFCVWRTIDGHPACAYSRDRGRTFSAPEYMRNADGRLMRHPRAANFVWKLSGGRYLYWFHNHGGRGYDRRNPAWLCGGVEYQAADGLRIAWSQPEILLYDDDLNVRMSYPDLLVDEGEYYFSQTQKHEARTCRADKRLIEGLFAPNLPTDALCHALPGEEGTGEMPPLPPFTQVDRHSPDFRSEDLRAGFTLWLRFHADARLLIDTMDARGAGLRATLDEDGRIRFEMSDGMHLCAALSDPVGGGDVHTAAIIVDGGPKLILSVVDGQLSDGGARQYGWARFAAAFEGANGAPRFVSRAQALKVFGRALLVSEARALCAQG